MTLVHFRSRPTLCRATLGPCSCAAVERASQHRSERVSLVQELEAAVAAAVDDLVVVVAADEVVEAVVVEAVASSGAARYPSFCPMR